jgi:hypothetical protein
MIMCEINPKRSAFYKLEFFTSQEITEEQWQEMVMKRLLELEQQFNERGDVRVHVHEVE